VLQRRTDDGDAAVFERRVGDYEARVEPVIDAWGRADLPLIRLDGTRDVDAISNELLDEVARLDGA
jgi:adenylate kinase family enzyme